MSYHFSKQIKIDIIIQALGNTYVSQKPKDKMILQTDLGSQYTTQEFKDLTSTLNMIQSFSRKEWYHHKRMHRSLNSLTSDE